MWMWPYLEGSSQMNQDEVITVGPHPIGLHKKRETWHQDGDNEVWPRRQKLGSSTSQATPRMVDSQQQLGREGDWILPQGLQKKPALLTPGFQTSRLQNWEKINPFLLLSAIKCVVLCDCIPRKLIITTKFRNRRWRNTELTKHKVLKNFLFCFFSSLPCFLSTRYQYSNILNRKCYFGLSLKFTALNDFWKYGHCFCKSPQIPKNFTVQLAFFFLIGIFKALCSLELLKVLDINVPYSSWHLKEKIEQVFF